ncbi:MAG: sigma-54 dependent transcriptional regulator [Ignavibacteria bacterium]|nr:sigma-54 dependent transcriptional regulator [Ignavibacteria bacterium]
MNANPSILIVDDEQVVRDSLSKWFKEDGFNVSSAAGAAETLQQLQGQKWDILLLDIKMPGMDGMELQQRIKEIDPTATIIFITAHATVDTAVKALKEGAFDYVTKPVDPDYLSHLVTNALKQRSLVNENLKLKEQISEFSKADEIVGDSAQIQKVYELIQTVAKTDTTVMIRGESGTGKELIARAIHSNSSRRYFPIVAVNCGAMAEGILESELFGHERGAFTGAQYRRKGKLELADGGSLFLDEVGNIDTKTQMDLLRVIETKQFARVGGNDIIRVDFRVICATNKDLEKAVTDGTFREDLYYRLNVFSVVIPPLRERKGDIPLLANYFVKKYSRAMGKLISSISPEAMDTIVRYNWPGNVRELENAIERAMVVGKPPEIRPEDLPYQLTERNHILPSGSMAAVEKAHIISVLAQNRWNISRSAEILQIDRVTLYNKIEKYGLKKPSAG